MLFENRHWTDSKHRPMISEATALPLPCHILPIPTPFAPFSTPFRKFLFSNKFVRPILHWRTEKVDPLWYRSQAKVSFRVCCLLFCPAIRAFSFILENERERERERASTWEMLSGGQWEKDREEDCEENGYRKFGSVWPDLAKFSMFQKVIFSIWQYFEPIRAKNCYWAKFHCCKSWQNIEK